MGPKDFAGSRFRQIEPGSAARRAEEARTAEAGAGMGPTQWIWSGMGARKAEQERSESVRAERGLHLRAATARPFRFTDEPRSCPGEALPHLGTPLQDRPSSQPEPAVPDSAAGIPDAVPQRPLRAPQARQPGEIAVIAALGSSLSRLKSFLRKTPVSRGSSAQQPNP